MPGADMDTYDLPRGPQGTHVGSYARVCWRPSRISAFRGAGGVREASMGHVGDMDSGPERLREKYKKGPCRSRRGEIVLEIRRVRHLRPGPQ